MLYYQNGSESSKLSDEDLKNGLIEAFGKLGGRKKVLVIPPDFTRYHSYAGKLTQFAWEYYGSNLTDILPALGTHVSMTVDEIKKMYGPVPADLFRNHDWRNSLVTLGEVPSAFVKEQSEGKLDYPWPAQVNKLVVEGGFDLILSIGQVVPHEVIGMANHNKNIFVGTGGQEGINKSHFLGAVYGMERMMGRTDTPVRRVINYAEEHFAADLPVVYVQTAVGRDKQGGMAVRGLFIGDGRECFEKAAEISLKINFTMVEKPMRKAVVYLDPAEFKSTWLGNKAIYRTRMAMADGGELIVLAPGVKEFGEDPEIDRLIRAYGYVGTPRILEDVKNNPELAANLSAAAHLIHGSSEDRFKITCCPRKLSKEEVESVNFNYAALDDMLKKYDPDRLKDGYNTMDDGEEIYFISNPALGLWAHKDRFN